MAHALLSASDSKRWLNCTPSARLTDGLPDKQTDATLEGTTAHAIAELKVRKALVEPMGPRAFNNRLKKLKAEPLYSDEMLKHTDTYLEYIEGIVQALGGTPHVIVEKRVDYSAYAPEGFGTADCIILHGADLWIVDFKYGKGVPVNAKENSQMMLYALGALHEYGMLYAIDTIHMTIVQPRLDSISEWEISRAGLEEWGETFVKPRAKLAFEGKGDFHPSEDVCRWCKLRPRCRAAYKEAVAIEDFAEMEPAALTPEEISEALALGKTLVSWYKALEEYALTECLSGDMIPGYKAVAGRSVRSFTDADAAFDALKRAGYKEDLLYERKPLTLAQLEKLVGKKEFAQLCGDLIITPPGKPTLVPEDDNRPGIRTNDAAADFGEG